MAGDHLVHRLIVLVQAGIRALSHHQSTCLIGYGALNSAGNLATVPQLVSTILHRWCITTL
jgi:hypothetical protein